MKTPTNSDLNIMSEHRSCLSDRTTPIRLLPLSDSLLWDIYKAALSIRERECIPVAGPSIDRRAFQYTSYVSRMHVFGPLSVSAVHKSNWALDVFAVKLNSARGNGFFQLPRDSIANKNHANFRPEIL